jgi:hypothetical protein
MTETYETITNHQIQVGDEISYREYGSYRAADRFRRGTVIEITPSRDGYKDPMIVGLRLENGRVTYPELLPEGAVRRYTV